MIVVMVSKCPERLRGDLTKWLYQVDTGLYVGSANGRIRDYLWERVLEYVGNGSAAMAYDARSESGVEIRLHNMRAKLKDYDGLFLPYVRTAPEKLQTDDIDMTPAYVGWRVPRRKRVRDEVLKMAFLDVETTGLDVVRDRITEIGMIRVDGNEIVSEWSSLIRIDRKVTQKSRNLTGITDRMLQSEGTDIADALRIVMDTVSVSGLAVMCYNQKFDIPFLDRALLDLRLGTIGGICAVHDVMNDVRKYFRSRDGPSSMNLEDVAAWFGIDTSGAHRALRDCQILYQVWNKVNENAGSKF